MVHQERISLQSGRHGHMHDITGEVARAVEQSKVTTGVAQVFAVGSTSAVSVVEFEPGLIRDVPEMLDRLIPPSREYGHEQAWHDGNGHSHLQATLMGPSLSVPITEGQLVLGTWQQVFHIDCDVRPRQRTVIVTILGE
jgi:secondary thiamine-phosphate synthase enzyme